MRFLSIIAFLILAQATPLYPSQPTKSLSAWGCSLLAFSGISSIAYGVYDWISNRRAEEYQKNQATQKNLKNDREILLNAQGVTLQKIRAMKSLTHQEKIYLINVISQEQSVLGAIESNLSKTDEEKEEARNQYDQRTLDALLKVSDAMTQREMRVDNNNSHRFRSHLAILTGFSLLTASIGMILDNK